MLLKLLLLFALGSIAGWILEVIRRRFTQGKFVNPGYFKGPYLPLYGFGVLLIYLISSLQISLIAKIILFAVLTTLLELITGLVFIIHFKLKLWDYSEARFNFKGIICLRNSIYWTVLSVLFYFLIYPFLRDILGSLSSYPTVLFFIGIFCGALFFDLCEILHTLYRIRSFVRAYNRKYKKNVKITYAKFRKHKPKINKIINQKLMIELKKRKRI